MKHDQLCAIGHNLIDSLASGMCFVIGVWSTDIFGEAAAGGGTIEIDFLQGQVVSGACSDGLRAAIKRFGEVLPAFCGAHGAGIADFTALPADFYANGQVSLTVMDHGGRTSVTPYAGMPLKRMRVLDDRGRVHRMPRQITIG